MGDSNLINPTIDLRPKLHCVRHQGRRFSCLAFATSAAHEHSIAAAEDLSPEYLFYHAVARMPGSNPNAGTSFSAMADALSVEGQPVEAAWPYTPSTVTPWTLPAISFPMFKAVMKFGKLTFDEIITYLDAGRSIVLGLVITDAFRYPDAIGVIADKTPDIERGGHAVVAVGHGNLVNGDQAILIRNSWGGGWGLAGHAWLSKAYIDLHLYETALIS